MSYKKSHSNLVFSLFRKISLLLLENVTIGGRTLVSWDIHVREEDDRGRMKRNIK
jgi:hypothetical protein